MSPTDGLPLIEGDGVRLQLVMGEAWGATSPVTSTSPTIYADIELAPGGAMPIDREADERALYLIEGDATRRRVPLGRSTSTLLAPGHRADPALATAARG